MGITSSKIANPLYSEKLFYEIEIAAAYTCTTTLANATGWSLTIPQDGKYRILAQFDFDLTDNSANGEVEGEYAFAVGGVTQTDTSRYVQHRGLNNSSHNVDSNHEWIDNFTAGDVITLQAREYNAGTAAIVNGTSGGTREAKFSYELIESVVPIASKPDYNSTEEPTGAKWIDGKPIYRKVVNFGAMPNATLKNVAHGITTIDVLINTYGSAHNTSTGDRRPLPHTNISGAGSSIQMVVDNTNIGIHTGTTDRTALNECFITLEYTKV